MKWENSLFTFHPVQYAEVAPENTSTAFSFFLPDLVGKVSR